MYQYDHPTASPTLPAPRAAGTPGYFFGGDPVLGLPRSVLDRDILNTIMLELLNVVVLGGQTPSKTNNTQLATAIQSLFAAGAAGTFGTVASASTTNLGAVPSRNVSVTGVTTISSFGSGASLTQPIYLVTFTGVLQIVNSAAIAVKGGQNITTAAGDYALLRYLGSGNWALFAYFRATGREASSGSNANGSWRIDSSGIVEQWGLTPSHSQNDGSIAYTFPIAFPTACENVQVALINPPAGTNTDFDQSYQVVSYSTTTFNLLVQAMAGASTTSTYAAMWRAIGR